MNDLVDPADGENRAVRQFLMAYGTMTEHTIGAVRTHMRRSGYPLWPDWVTDALPAAHLTKGGAQAWLRHLFALETL